MRPRRVPRNHFVVAYYVIIGSPLASMRPRRVPRNHGHAAFFSGGEGGASMRPRRVPRNHRAEWWMEAEKKRGFNEAEARASESPNLEWNVGNNFYMLQ